MSRHTVYVIPRAWREIKALPGNMRQRVKRAVEALADNPRPSKSKAWMHLTLSTNCDGFGWIGGALYTW